MTTPSAFAAGTTPAYSVVIPCYNERDNIIALADEVRTACASDDFEIVVVDDRSTDDTLAQLQAAQPRFGGRLRVVRHGVNSGQSAGVCTGVDHARGLAAAARRAHGGDPPVRHGHVGVPARCARAIDDEGVGDEQIVHGFPPKKNPDSVLGDCSRPPRRPS